MRKFGIAQQAVLFISILICSCSNNPQVLLNEISSKATSYDETIHINNCGGKGESEQTASRSFTSRIEGGGEIMAGYQGIIEGRISAKYSQYRNVSKSHSLVAPPATNMVFVLRWSEEVRAGNVTVDGLTGTYEVRIPIAVEQVSGNDLDSCEGNVPISTTSPLLSTQSPIVINPQKTNSIPRIQNPLCPFTISESEISSLTIGFTEVPIVQAYINKFDSGRPGNGGAFTKGTTIPAGVVVATNFDEINPNKWSEYPVIAIVHSGSWGLFQTTGEYIAPNAGACRVIVP